MVGFFRVPAGAHYPGDIVAAAVIAALASLEVLTGRRVRESMMAAQRVG